MRVIENIAKKMTKIRSRDLLPLPPPFLPIPRFIAKLVAREKIEDALHKITRM